LRSARAGAASALGPFTLSRVKETGSAHILLCNFADLSSSAFTASIPGTFRYTWTGDSLHGFGVSESKNC
jgi:hypothetical protein